MKNQEILNKPEVKKNSLGFDSNLYVYQDKTMFNYSVDTILLGNFINLTNKTKSALEIGTNNGALSIFVASRSKKLKIDALEIQAKALELAEINVKLNNLENQINLIHGNFNDFYKNHCNKTLPKYDVIFCNPPFYIYEKQKVKKEITKEQLIANYEVKLNLEQIIAGSAKIIQQKGELSIVLPIERLVDLFTTLRKYNFEPKKVQFVYTRKSARAKFVLCNAKFNSPYFTEFLPALFLHADDEQNHEYLPEIKQIYKPIKIDN
ncbi:tRNA1(Val) (adenine(37)-N6)-methyltransferase [Mycoplasmopsis synoviae]|uniref:tRNA1(Val) (adenine(37)-N6)-methyltransferase n=1 Tax=Mycoplasmopsis synoviae TaxID=2109 RepID=UPI000CA3D1D9|nr:tRNA1(Val) (adenine(37)-N6)-methyltransferase [Mycoplasmopsis synoviae]AKJ20538.1 tRNA (adenine37-N(6))-methyltransferase TrmN6 [Mycoplasmopsis synoviae]AQU47851.1 tRNA (adenine37-N(6))-methyltransferase TrmN6 [Mycoplasmopsis synoviae]AWL84108.1 lactate dehydrogenase [Mycoplasmopsis synoviae]QLE13828.1 lactate dehydrogenase [Mycoplasmopsis synoviae]UZF64604.1 tRNA1(Val) (adenine(37)-N6)-methyltransferase [Mycoplasmopsis synoviae]